MNQPRAVSEDQLRRMNEELRALVAGRGQRHAAELLPEVHAVMTRYGVLEPDTEGLLQWIGQMIVEADSGRAE
jgi:hypothetical protein